MVELGRRFEQSLSIAYQLPITILRIHISHTHIYLASTYTYIIFLLYQYKNLLKDRKNSTKGRSLTKRVCTRLLNPFVVYGKSELIIQVHYCISSFFYHSFFIQLYNTIRDARLVKLDREYAVKICNICHQNTRSNCNNIENSNDVLSIRFTSL